MPPGKQVQTILSSITHNQSNWCSQMSLDPVSHGYSFYIFYQKSIVLNQALWCQGIHFVWVGTDVFSSKTVPVLLLTHVLLPVSFLTLSTCLPPPAFILFVMLSLSFGGHSLTLCTSSCGGVNFVDLCPWMSNWISFWALFINIH